MEPDAERAPTTPRRLFRSREDRMVAGVAGGLGDHLGIDPVLVRIVFVVLAFAGGSGILAYVIAWIVIPEAPAGRPAPPDPPGGGGSVIAGLVLIAVGGLMLVDRLVPRFEWRFVAPALLIAIGILLVTRKWMDR